MSAHISVIGAGYLGATHAACMAELGHEVLGVDVDAEKVAVLSTGQVSFYEPGLQDLLSRHVASGRLRFTTSVAEAGAFADVHFLCVGTPQRHGGYAADLRPLEGALNELARHLTRPALVVGKSTVPVGTAERLSARLGELAPVGLGVDLAWNPEFLREGNAVADTLRPDRLVAGVQSPRAEQMLREVYASPLAEGVPFVVTDLATAELTKVAANSFVAMKVSFINAMAELCEVTGADVVTLADAIGYDPRIGRRHLNAGLGFGGGCLPKDIRAFMARAGELGVDQALTFLREVDAINMRRRHRMVDLAREECDGDVLGKRVGVLGAAFKPRSDDVRDSPALNVAAQLQLQGAHVTVYDPRANANAQRLFPTLQYAGDVAGAVRDADLVLHLTEWDEFRNLDPEVVGDLVAKRRMLDGRNALDPDRWRAAGWSYRALGRP
ncbi:MAG: nucleotide sugar dehydrogenase [Propionibacteriales bacterium]|nr:nucleotide sugar dehydrogenase [Propionibacteriales bacterium]